MHNLLAEEPINDFLTAQLVCEDRPSGQRYNVLTDVFALRRDPNDPASTQFYGLFTSSPPSGERPAPHRGSRIHTHTRASWDGV